MVNLDGDAEGGGLTQCPRGVELPVLLGLKHHRGQLAAADVDDHGEGNRVLDQMAVREQSAAGRGVGRDGVPGAHRNASPGSARPAFILPASDVDAVEHANLADTGHQPVEFVLVADRETDAGQGGSHVITFHYAQVPRRRLTGL